MRNRKGFIAVSLIYSFFLVFLMIMLSNSLKDAQTRLVLGTIKKDIQANLNQEEEFIVTNIPNKNYNVGEEVNFVGESWLTVENKTGSVVLVLKRALNKEEVTKSLNVENTNADYFAGACTDSSCKVRMCMNKYYDNLCYFETTSNFIYYTWQNSVAKKIVDEWFLNNVNLQKVCRFQANSKACTKDTMISMTFHDGISNNTGYIRIATNAEAAIGRSKWVINNGGYMAQEAWTLTKQNLAGGKSILYDIQGALKQNDHVMTIRPIIEVRKI